MPTFALIMLAESLLGFVIAAALSLSACKSIAGNSLKKASLIILIGIVLINVIYTGIAAWLIYNRAFAVDVSMTMKTPCYVLGLMSFICSVIQGAVIKAELENNKSTKVIIEKLLIPEIISLVGILYFFMQSQIPL